MSLEKKIEGLEKKFENLNLNYTTVFDINLKTATKTVSGTKCLTAKNDQYILHQPDVQKAPTSGSDHIENTGGKSMSFLCPEMMFGNISVFIVCEVADTSISGSSCFLIGNDDGSYDKYLAFKSYSYFELIVGGIRHANNTTVNIPITHSINHKHILSCHWMQHGSCLYVNGVKISGSDFKPDLLHIGSTKSNIFLPSSGNINSQLKGKIFGIKIVQGCLEPSDIKKINKDMMKEYGNII